VLSRGGEQRAEEQRIGAGERSRAVEATDLGNTAAA
jgi:hypothetical protein